MRHPYYAIRISALFVFHYSYPGKPVGTEPGVYLCKGADYRTNELPHHLKRALDNGVTRDELIELITHLAFYAGWPTANTAVTIARGVFEENGV